MPLFAGELERALAKPGCPICRIVRCHEEAWIWHTLYEFTGDPDVRSRFDASYGLCRPHAQLMIQVVEAQHLGGSGVARMYETVVMSYREKLAALRKPPGRVGQWLRLRRQRLQPLKARGCMLCAASRRSAQGISFFLLKALQDPKESGRWWRKYSESDGFCNPHLLIALRDEQARTNPALWKFLVEDHLKRLKGLQERLYQLQRKQSYDVDEEITPEEVRSWKEVIWRFTAMGYEKLLWRVGP